MAKFVHEDVRRLIAVGRDRAVQPEDPAAAVGSRVGENLDELVRRERGGLSELRFSNVNT